MSAKVTQSEFETRIKDIYNGQFTVKGKYINAITKVDIQCNKCNHIFSRIPNHLYNGTTICPNCGEKQYNHVVKGVNDLWITHPEIAALLANPDEGHLYSHGTSKNLDFICPKCGNHKFAKPSNIINKGFNCDYCSDGLSYPNKFIRNLFQNLNVNFIPEYKIDNYFYDLYFEYKNKKYLIEMDGGFNHGFKNNQHMSIEEQLKNDRKKDNLALNKGYILIRIDCNYLDQSVRQEYIIKNIKNSIIQNIFNISDDIYKKVSIDSLESNVLKFASLYRKGIYEYEVLLEKINVKSCSTIRRYAKQCISCGLLKEPYDVIIKKLYSKKKKSPRHVQPIMCNETGAVYISIAEVKRLTGITHLDRFFNGKTNYCGKLQDGTKLTWKKISKAEYAKLKTY